MSSVADAPMADLCREAEPATVTAFVADLYEARGWTVDRRGDRQLVVSDGDRETNVAIVHPSDPDPGPDFDLDPSADVDPEPDVDPKPNSDSAPDLLAWADRIVVSGSTETVVSDVDADIVDAATLGRQVGYAVDRPEARRLLRTHFGWTPDPADGRGSEASVGKRANETPGTLDPFELDTIGARLPDPVAGRSGILLATVVVLAVAGSVALVVTGELVGESPGVAADSAAPNGSTAVTTPRSSGRSAPSINQEYMTLPETPVRTFATLPPGVNQSGAIDTDRLLDAHRAALENRSYRVSITYRESIDGRPTGVYTETIRVVNATRYSVSVSRRGDLRAPIPSVAETDIYADGTVRYEKIGDSVIERSVVSYDRFLIAHVSLLGVFLDARESSIADYQPNNVSASDGSANNRSAGDETASNGTASNETANGTASNGTVGNETASTEMANGTATVYVVTDGNPARLITDTTGSFDVRTDGFISRGHWTYSFSPNLSHYEGIEASFSIQVTDVGSTTVHEPDWVREHTTTPTSTPASTPTPTPENASGT